MKLITFFVVLVIGIPSLAFGALPPKIAKFDDEVYYPSKLGVNDLVVTIELKDLVKRLKKEKNFEKLKDVYFEFYWAGNDKQAIEVFGLPSGFNEIKATLRNAIASYAEYYIPRTLDETFSGYTFSEKTYGYFLKDPTGKKRVNEFEIKLDKNGDLKEIESRIGSSTVVSSFVYKWNGETKKRKLLEKVTRNFTGPQAKVRAEVEIDYDKINGFFFPEKITSSNYIPVDKSENSSTEVIVSRDIKVNTGEAAKWFLKNKNDNQ